MNLLRTIKNVWWLALLMFSLPNVHAFSLGGPIGNGGDSWQSPTIGYGLPGDLNAPKNIGEEYRRNTPVLYFTYDAAFLDFFGSNGVVAVQGAMDILNNTFTNEFDIDGGTNRYLTHGVDDYDLNLTGYPINGQHINFTAVTLALTDLKSEILGAMTEQLGLTDPDRYVWTLHDRFLPPGGKCPLDEEYLVIQRNFDYAPSALNQLQYSSYINDTLYTYEISEICSGPNPLGVTVPFSTDPSAPIDTAVASDGQEIGGFYTSLTRDDVAGLKYLLSTNNANVEDVAAGSLLSVTNLGQTIFITSSSLSTLLQASLTNPPATLLGLFPGLTINSTSNSFEIVVTTNYISYVTNQNGNPFGFGQLVTVPVVSSNFQFIYFETFGNVITNGNFTNNPNIILASTNFFLSFSTNTIISTTTTQLKAATGQPYPPPPVTNVTTTTSTISVPSGEYIILPPGACGFNILGEIPLPTVFATNIISSATNANGFVDTVSQVTSFTPHQFAVQPINCSTVVAASGLYQGIEKILFTNADFDSLLGQFFQPITNTYTMTMVTNSQATVENLQRVVTAPDFVFSAADLVSGPGAIPVVASYSRNLNFDTAHVLPGLAGPGTINPATTISFNKVGDVFANGTLALYGLATNAFLGEINQGSGFGIPNNISILTWASFDQTTNPPVIYPNGTSIQNLEYEMLVQISPTTLADATNGVSYTPVTFSATGGAFTTPFTWVASGLPAGLSMSSGGTLSGTPTQSGTFDITIQLTDSLGRSVQWSYSIIVH